MTLADLAAGRLVLVDVPDLPAHAWEIALAYRTRKELGLEMERLLAILRQPRYLTIFRTLHEDSTGFERL